MHLFLHNALSFTMVFISTNNFCTSCDGGILSYAVMAGQAPEGSQSGSLFDGRQYDAKMTEL